VQKALAWPSVWPNVREHLLNRPVGIYNAEFDLRMMRQSMERYRLPWRENLNAFDILQLYSEYRGVWDPYKKSYRFFKLEEAGRQLGISIPNAHRAVVDARLARAVLHRLAGLEY
jgi:DNA polymerase-3 subunit epsilon